MYLHPPFLHLHQLLLVHHLGRAKYRAIIDIPELPSCKKKSTSPRGCINKHDYSWAPDCFTDLEVVLTFNVGREFLLVLPPQSICSFHISQPVIHPPLEILQSKLTSKKLQSIFALSKLTSKKQHNPSSPYKHNTNTMQHNLRLNLSFLLEYATCMMP